MKAYTQVGVGNGHGELNTDATFELIRNIVTPSIEANIIAFAFAAAAKITKEECFSCELAVFRANKCQTCCHK